MKSLEAFLVLEDGRVFRGEGLGPKGQTLGEVVFNTSMTGYQEIISDPSYCGQIVTFTAPQIGNYGVCEADDQAARPALSGLVIRELSPVASNHRATARLDEYLTRHGTLGITEVDTRALTRHLRERGAMRGGIFIDPPAGADLLGEVRAAPSMVGLDLTGRVTTREPYTVAAQGMTKHRIALVDFGVKRGIVQSLTRRGLEVHVLPAAASAEDVLKLAPEGLVLSNGPGDPAAVGCGIGTARALLGKLPILGICLGHQLLGLALGGSTYKLRFGHHGGNHPVRDEETGAVWITAQNHNFAVDPRTLTGHEVRCTHRSLYDGTLEGFEAAALGVLAVQFHPEACPGPSDAQGVFDRFVSLLEQGGQRAPA